MLQSDIGLDVIDTILRLSLHYFFYYENYLDVVLCIHLFLISFYTLLNRFKVTSNFTLLYFSIVFLTSQDTLYSFFLFLDKVLLEKKIFFNKYKCFIKSKNVYLSMFSLVIYL